MSSSSFQARRATVDDLVELRQMWQSAGLPVHDLEKRLTEFQIVEEATGGLVAALGLHIQGQQGRLHSETYRESENSESVRRLLWQRVQSLARNYGLHRIWMAHQTRYWNSLGFEEPSPEMREKLPAEFGNKEASWLVLQLRDEVALSISLEKELEAFALAQKESSERVLRQVQWFKNVAYGALFIVVLFGLLAVVLAIVPKTSRSRLFQNSRPSPIQSQPLSTSTNPAPAQAATNNAASVP